MPRPHCEALVGPDRSRSEQTAKTSYPSLNSTSAPSRRWLLLHTSGRPFPTALSYQCPFRCVSQFSAFDYEDDFSARRTHTTIKSVPAADPVRAVCILNRSLLRL